MRHLRRPLPISGLGASGSCARTGTEKRTATFQSHTANTADGARATVAEFEDHGHIADIGASKILFFILHSKTESKKNSGELEADAEPASPCYFFSESGTV